MKIEVRRATIMTVDSFPLRAAIVSPINKESRSVIMISAGTGVRKEFYLNFAKFLAEAQFAVVLYDYRGIGESRPYRLGTFDAHMRDWGQKDMYSVVEWISTNHPGKPIHAIGHSNGGQQIGFLPNHKKISKILMVGASTGYWRNLRAPYKYFTAFIWYVFVPLTTSLIGYAPASWFGLGEDLPKNVAREWRDWCTSESYFEKYFAGTIGTTFFSEIKAPIYSIYAEDDPIATDKTVTSLLRYFTASTITIYKVIRADIGARRIGHFGFFSRAFKRSLWPVALDFLRA